MDFRTPRFSKIGPFKLPLHTGAHYRSGQSEIALPLRKSRFPTDASEMPLSPRQVCPVPSGSLYIPLILSASVRSGSVVSRCNCTLGRCPSYSANPCGLCCTFDFVSEIYRYAYGCLRARVLLRNTLRPLLSLRFPSETYRPRFREL